VRPQEAGTEDDRKVAYVIYLAELDREESAATELARDHASRNAA
jgi:hypothetical protein